MVARLILDPHTVKEGGGGGCLNLSKLELNVIIIVIDLCTIIIIHNND